MGAQVRCGDGWIEVQRGRFPLQAITLDCNHIPDAAMTLATMALYAQGTTRLENIASWRVKETDRISAMAQELRKLGAHVVDGADFIEVTAPTHWRSATIDTYDDHRIAMCFSLAAFSALATANSDQEPVTVRIKDPKCVAKTFPDYFETFFSVVSTTPQNIPVLTIDGPTASGKGTVASLVARALGYHFLDSGAVYRATGLAAQRQGISIDDEEGLARCAADLILHFDEEKIFMSGEDVSHLLRQEEAGAIASKVSQWPAVRTALKALQLSYRRVPGLVADGRDMGTVIFPDADMKIFLTANAATRAERRHKQLISKGISSSIADLRADLEARDRRDSTRSVAPLMPAEDAVLLDSSALSIEASVDAVLKAWQERRPAGLV
jgi:3-phosphoshikimate 1-carboxyvinyltransferase